MNATTILVSIVIGVIVGGIASGLPGGTAWGPIGHVVAGLIGSIIGGSLLRTARFELDVGHPVANHAATAAIGAVLVVAMAKLGG